MWWLRLSLRGPQGDRNLRTLGGRGEQVVPSLRNLLIPEKYWLGGLREIART